jgi:hypothetical protein
MAIVLTPDGQRIKDKDLKALSEEFAEWLDIPTALEVAADFLSCNPISAISAQYRSLVSQVWEMMKGTETSTKTKTGSRGWLSRYVQGIFSGGTASSGRSR